MLGMRGVVNCPYQIWVLNFRLAILRLQRIKTDFFCIGCYWSLGKDSSWLRVCFFDNFLVKNVCMFVIIVYEGSFIIESNISRFKRSVLFSFWALSGAWIPFL